MHCQTKRQTVNLRPSLYCPGPGLNRTCGKQWSRDYPIDSPRSSMLTFATKKLSTSANGRKKDALAASFLLSAQF